MRLIPNLAVVRPADAMEVAAAWTIALERRTAPTAFALSRQKVPSIKRVPNFDPKAMLRGAYVVSEPKNGAPEVVLIATGSELGLAADAQAKLEAEGKRVRVVSALCLERFAEQDAAYRDTVLPKGVRRVSIEAGATGGWRGWVGESGLTIGIDHFGASAPDKVLAQKFGFTTDAVCERIRAWW
jgi:transketolase